MKGFWFLQAVGALAPSAVLHAAIPLDVKFGPPDATRRASSGGFLIAVNLPDHRLVAEAACGWRARQGGGRHGGASGVIRSRGLHLPPHPETIVVGMDDAETSDARRPGGTQAVMRAIDILEAVAEGPISLPDLVARVGMSKATCHRIASALVERGLLKTSGRTGYRLGPLLAELAAKSGDSLSG